MAILDSGCSKTVCGKKWLSVYLDTLSVMDRKSVKRNESSNQFRFGGGQIFPSMGSVYIPIYIGTRRIILCTDTVVCDVPLLLSRETLQKLHTTIDFKDNKVSMLDIDISIVLSDSGHYCLPLAREMKIGNKHTDMVLVNFKLDNINDRKKIIKLHRQFSHPSAVKLNTLLKESGITDKNVFKLVREVSQDCDTCIQSSKSHLRPVVGFPHATTFNECLAVDLKVLGPNVYILHIIDHLTRYASACIIHNKKKGSIVKGFMNVWFRIFGAPQSILCDNGGEFINDEITDLCEKFNIYHKATAAESAWSNGLVEKHNGVIAGMVKKTMKDTKCCEEIALNWALAAKNSLTTVYGFSPNTLVFGRNPNLPNILINKMPANNPVCISKYLSDTLNAMHVARMSFIEHERSERIRRALLRKTRSFSDQVFNLGDMVYFHRNDDIWHGPAKIVGVDGTTYLLKQGGSYSRVHACKMKLVPHVDLGNSEEVIEQPSINTDSHGAISSADCETNSASLQKEIAVDDEFDTDAELTEESLDNDVENSTVTVQSRHHLPKSGIQISFQLPDDEHWRSCTILSRGGKASTANWHFLNVREEEENKCLSFRGAKWVEKTPSLASSHDNIDEHDILILDNSNDTAAFDDAKDNELIKWKQMKVYKEVPDDGQSTISTRWVLTKKVKNEQTIHKARLVVRGFEENSDSLQKDSPICGKDTLRLIFSIFASKGWTLYSLDVKAAFLQGLPIEREVYLKPPKHAGTDKLWLLLQCPYGLTDASRKWYLRVVCEFCQLGGKQSKYDKAVFIWHDSNGELIGIVACHVDDFLLAGNSEFHQMVVIQIRNVFAIGSEESCSFKYIGMDISCFDSKIQLSMSSYAASIRELDLSAFSQDKSCKLSLKETLILKRVAGQINWLVTQCRPDLAYENCLIGNSMKHATVNDIILANKAIRKVKCNDIAISFRSIDVGNCCLVAFCDASFASLPNGGSQTAFIVFLIDSNGVYSPLTWQSRRTRRVVNSTVAAECLAAIEAANSSVLLKAMIQEFYGLNIDVFIYSDNRNLVDCVKTCTSVEDKKIWFSRTKLLKSDGFPLINNCQIV